MSTYYVRPELSLEEIVMKAEFKILCSTYQACSEVKEFLIKLGFTNLKDLDNSPSFDIGAKYELKNEERPEKIAQKIFKECKEKVQFIQTTTKG